MTRISLLCAAATLCVPALCSAQTSVITGGGTTTGINTYPIEQTHFCPGCGVMQAASLTFFAHHELRLAWRDWLSMMTASVGTPCRIAIMTGRSSIVL